MFTRESAPLDDCQVAMVVQRGTTIQLTLYQEEQVLEESGLIQPAKSFTVNNESVRALKEFLNSIDLEVQ